MLDGIAEEGVWIGSACRDGLLDGRERDTVGVRRNTCGRQERVLLVLIVARPVCLAHCAHPPTDGTEEVEVNTALAVWLATVARRR